MTARRLVPQQRAYIRDLTLPGLAPLPDGITAGPPYVRWSALPPEGRYSAGEPGSRWSASYPHG
jgi:hypothetical protein